MANHRSAEKANRQNEKRRIINRNFRNRARTFVKKARVAIHHHNPNLDEATEAVRQAVRDLDMAARRGVIHPRNAARRKGRLMKQLDALKKQHAS